MLSGDTLKILLDGQCVEWRFCNSWAIHENPPFVWHFVLSLSVRKTHKLRHRIVACYKDTHVLAAAI